MAMTIRRAIFDAKDDPRNLPTYVISEAAHYLGMPVSTLRSWVIGRPYSTDAGLQFFKPIIELAGKQSALLSFMNLVEAHVLDAIRREHKVSLSKVRTALKFLRSKFPSPHPLADQRFETDGLDLFVESYGRLINVSSSGQLAMRDLLRAYLRRIDRDLSGVPLRLYPFTRSCQWEQPKWVVIDPAISYGRPVLVGTGIPTAVIAERYKAGESIDDLVDDYGRERPEIEEAIRCELFEAA